MRQLLGILLIVMLGCGRTAPAEKQTATTQPLAHLVIHIVDLRNQTGQLLFCIFNSADGFPGDSKLAVNSQIKKVATDNVFVVDLPPGTYAADVVHDENSNGKLDTNFLGIPKEGYGVTNNPKPRRRSVNYAESQFILPLAGAELSISLQYNFF